METVMVSQLPLVLVEEVIMEETMQVVVAVEVSGSVFWRWWWWKLGIGWSCSLKVSIPPGGSAVPSGGNGGDGGGGGGGGVVITNSTNGVDGQAGSGGYGGGGGGGAGTGAYDTDYTVQGGSGGVGGGGGGGGVNQSGTTPAEGGQFSWRRRWWRWRSLKWLSMPSGGTDIGNLGGGSGGSGARYLPDLALEAEVVAEEAVLEVLSLWIAI